MEMSWFFKTARGHAEVYGRRTDQTIVEMAGAGVHGVLFTTTRRRHLKIFVDAAPFERELECYQRLEAAGVGEVHGHAIPGLMGHDADLLLLDLSTVARPFVLDFAGVELDTPLEERWPAATLAGQMKRWESNFSADQWPTVLRIWRELGETHGIWSTDLHLGNFGFPPDDAR